MKGTFITAAVFVPETLPNGVVRTVKGHLDDLMVVELRWKRGMKGAVHTHPHRQCSYIIEGEFEAEVDGEKRVLRGGECVYVEADVPHGLCALSETGVVLDVFTPMREDFVK